MSKTNRFSRRDFVRSSALVVSASAAPSNLFAVTYEPLSTNEASPIRLGLASYTFRNFSRAQMIGFMKQLNVFALNAKDVKDHLPTDAQQEAAALAGLRRGGHQAARCRNHLFPERRRCEHPEQVRILQASGYCGHSRRRPGTGNSAAN